MKTGKQWRRMRNLPTWMIDGDLDDRCFSPDSINSHLHKIPQRYFRNARFGASLGARSSKIALGYFPQIKLNFKRDISSTTVTHHHQSSL